MLHRFVGSPRFADRLDVESTLDGRLGIVGERPPSDGFELLGDAVILLRNPSETVTLPQTRWSVSFSERNEPGI